MAAGVASVEFRPVGPLSDRASTGADITSNDPNGFFIRGVVVTPWCAADPNRDGQVTPLERVRTFERALNRIVELTRQVDRGHGVCVIVGHADAQADAERIGRDLEPIAETLMIQPLGPVVGAHAGPGVVGVGCYPAELFPLGIKHASSAQTPA